MPSVDCDTVSNSVEDTLNNIHALQTFLLFVLENTTGDELQSLKAEIVTTLYLLGDQVSAAQCRLDKAQRQALIPEPQPDPAHAPA